jgi:O-antigen ligase
LVRGWKKEGLHKGIDTMIGRVGSTAANRFRVAHAEVMVLNHVRRSTVFTTQQPLYVLAAVVGVIGGASVAQTQGLASSTVASHTIWGAMLLALLASAYLAITLRLEPELLFTLWLFAAPLFQESALAQHTIAKDLGRALYVYPPLILGVILLVRGFGRPLKAIDALPLLYYAYILVSAKLISAQPQGFRSDLHKLYVTVGIGIVLYYFVAFGPTTQRLAQRVAAALLGSGTLVAAMAIVEGRTGWNLWHDTTNWRGHGISRAVATMANPAVLGTFLGMVLAFAVAILLWDGPRPLKKLSRVFIVLAIPALYFTYTRGPMLAIAVVAVGMALLANRARWQSLLLLGAAVLAFVVLWGSFKSTAVYQARFGNTHNIEARSALQKASFSLAAQRPVLGWGFGSFDVVKQNADVQAGDAAALAYNTSHNTLLTVLVELGALGVFLFLLPWIVISRWAISAATRSASERWLFAGVVGALITYLISASTYDARFFSFVPALPWVLLAVVRRGMGEEEIGDL